MEKYNFKLLTLAAVLALYNCAYRGTIEDMCEYLGEDKNEEAIITAIEQLEKKRGPFQRFGYNKASEINGEIEDLKAKQEKILNSIHISIKDKSRDRAKFLYLFFNTT